MALAHLIVANRAAAASEGATSGPWPEACAVNTCLRQVLIGAEPALAAPTLHSLRSEGFATAAGSEAYHFLLTLSCGLESEIAGETEIFGQIKNSWRAFETASPERAAPLRPWMQRLLQDTKEIRSEYVVGLGSATYGSLVRRLLQDVAAGPILLVGAGQLAESIVPFLDAGEVLIWNRSRSRAEALLAAQRVSTDRSRVKLVESTAAAEQAAWLAASSVVICIPPDATRDAERVAWWQARDRSDGRVLHLGVDAVAGTSWEAVPQLATLKDLFKLRDSHAAQRDTLLAKARKACASKAQLARLDDADASKAGNANHGWEDLAVFQAFGF
jgi:Glutamyl-tRNAGlu reductase, N-terminal domain